MGNMSIAKELHEREARKRQDNAESIITRGIYQAIVSMHDAGCPSTRSRHTRSREHKERMNDHDRSHRQ